MKTHFQVSPLLVLAAGLALMLTQDLALRIGLLLLIGLAAGLGRVKHLAPAGFVLAGAGLGVLLRLPEVDPAALGVGVLLVISSALELVRLLKSHPQ